MGGCDSISIALARLAAAHRLGVAQHQNVSGWIVWLLAGRLWCSWRPADDMHRSGKMGDVLRRKIIWLLDVWCDVCLVRIGYIYISRDFMGNVPSWNPPRMGQRCLKYVSHQFGASNPITLRRLKPWLSLRLQSQRRLPMNLGWKEGRKEARNITYPKRSHNGWSNDPGFGSKGFPVWQHQQHAEEAARSVRDGGDPAEHLVSGPLAACSLVNLMH